MMRVGRPLPAFHFPALMNGALTYLSLKQFRGHWILLCCLSHIGLIEATILNRQAKAFSQAESCLLAVTQNPLALYREYSQYARTLHAPILIDLLGRIAPIRKPLPASCNPCCSLLIDHEGVLRFTLDHDFNDRSMRLLTHFVGEHHQSETLTF